MTHPFGDFLSQFLHRKHGLSQMKLATGIDQPPQIITLMAKGQRLTGPQARERVLAIITWLHREGALTTVDDANALLAVAGMANLAATTPTEAHLLQQLSGQSAPAVLPSPPVPSKRQTNLPFHLTRFIGRSYELAHIPHLLVAARLVTLTGVGGTGKTRLAHEVGAAMLGQYQDGVWLVELAPLGDPELLPQAIAAAQSVREEAGRPLIDLLVDALAPKRLLLILDNCEHLLNASAQIAEYLLHHCPHLSILATSREALGIGGERIFRVPSLAVPDAGFGDLSNLIAGPPLHKLIAESESVQLFLDRALSYSLDFSLTPENAMAIAQICQQLDGIPLALELAAARLQTLSVEQVAARLDDQFRLLTGGSRTALPRHQTMRASIDWSYRLLSAPEQILLSRLVVFAGGWTLGAAQEVCSDNEIDAGDILDLLDGLVGKSLVVRTDEEADVRYRLLEPVRQYAREKHAEAGDLAAVRDRHLGYFMVYAEQAEPGRERVALTARLHRLQQEHANLRAALTWAKESGQVEAGLRLASALCWFWVIQRHWREGYAWLEELLAIRGPAADAVQAKALVTAGEICIWLGNLHQAQAYGEQSLEIYRTLDDPVGLAFALMVLCSVAKNQGRWKDALPLAKESLSLFREAGHFFGIARASERLGANYLNQGNHVLARPYCEESLELWQAFDLPSEISLVLLHLAYITGNERGAPEGLKLLEEGLAYARAGGDINMTADFLHQIGNFNRTQGRYEQAQAFLTESLLLYESIGKKYSLGTIYFRYAQNTVAQGHIEQTIQYCLECDRICRHIGAERITIYPRTIQAEAEYYQGNYTTAWKLLEECLAVYRDLSRDGNYVRVLYIQGLLLLAQGDPAAAQARLLECLEGHYYMAVRWDVSDILDALVEVALAQGQPEWAARLAGFVEQDRSTRGYLRPIVVRPAYERCMAALQSQLDPHSIKRIWAEGAAMTLEQVVVSPNAPWYTSET